MLCVETASQLCSLILQLNVIQGQIRVKLGVGRCRCARTVGGTDGRIETMSNQWCPSSQHISILRCLSQLPSLSPSQGPGLTQRGPFSSNPGAYRSRDFSYESCNRIFGMPGSLMTLQFHRGVAEPRGCMLQSLTNLLALGLPSTTVCLAVSQAASPPTSPAGLRTVSDHRIK